MPDAPVTARRYSWRTAPWALIALVLFTAVLRAGVLWAQFTNLQGDPDAYRRIAENLLQWGVLSNDSGELIAPPQPTAFRPPLYPALLALSSRDLGLVLPLRVAVCHWLLGMATVLLMLDLGARLGLGAMRYVGAVLVACDPILLGQSTLVMTETLAAFLTVVALHSLTRYSQQPEIFRAAFAGGAIGLAVLCRPTYLPWLGLVVLLTFVANRPALKGRSLAAAAMLGGAFLVLLPWGWRNARELKTFTVTTTHGGYTLWLGNNPEFYAHLRQGKTLETFTPIGEPGFMQSIGDETPFEVRYDELLYDEARAAIRAEPAMFAYACCYRLYQLVNPLPHPRPNGESFARSCLRYAVAGWYLTVYILAGFGLLKLRREFWKTPWAWGFTLCLAFVAVHALYWTNLRMRGPLMPFIALVAAAGAVHLAEPFVHANLLRRKNLRSC